MLAVTIHVGSATSSGPLTVPVTSSEANAPNPQLSEIVQSLDPDTSSISGHSVEVGCGDQMKVVVAEQCGGSERGVDHVQSSTNSRTAVVQTTESALVAGGDSASQQTATQVN